ncbi:uncharacterized protein LOC124895344 [Capsicum annuum]|uniref:uncharacterized protein LOC124895344 n=1 Tax=Capsicum annuum TaxID=4072 RepID=UPI001FB186B1|nr:uncharacterized protein LOC124895344 [Capsicum annuum]
MGLKVYIMQKRDVKAMSALPLYISVSEKNSFNEFVSSSICNAARFDHCRLVIVVDASYIRGLYSGIFVAACTVDGAGHIFSLAYGIVDSENDASWTWFFQNLKEAYGEREHMNSHDALSEIFYTMAKSYSKSEFHNLMEKVEVVDVRVKNYLELEGYDKWDRSYATVHRGWTLTSNIAESINVALVSARELPIYDFLEEVRLMFGRWNCENRQEALYTRTDLIEKFQAILQQNEVECTRMKVIPASKYVYTVHDMEKHFIVYLKEKNFLVVHSN